MTQITALLLDRDGTVIKDKHYLADPAGVELLPGVAEALKELAGRGTQLFLVSNQSGVGRGFFLAEAVEACNARLHELLAPFGVRFTDSIFCPHAPEETCACRKPGIGMWETLQARHGLAPAATAMVGDKPEDMAFAARAGLVGRILVLSGKGAATAQTQGLDAVLKASSLVDNNTPAENSLWRIVRQGETSPDVVIAGFSSLTRAVELLEQEGHSEASLKAHHARQNHQGIVE